MNDRAPAVRERLTPNQLDKQRQIVEAAKTVLATQGLAACTAREVAAAGPLTKSAIHYYFADMDVLIDRAMGEHVAALAATLRAAGDFWATVDAYLVAFREQPHVTRLWFEYWIDAARKDRLAAVAAMHDAMAAVFAERLADAGVADPAAAGRAVFTHLLGAIVDDSVRPPDPARLRADLTALARLPGPA
jgi:DNA-binding transcriptional regulator YbjK